MGLELDDALYVFVPFTDRPMKDPELRRDAYHVRELLASNPPDRRSRSIAPDAEISSSSLSTAWAARSRRRSHLKAACRRISGSDSPSRRLGSLMPLPTR